MRPKLPALTKEFTNLLVENLIASEEQAGRAIFHQPTRDFFTYLQTACNYNRAHRSLVARKFVPIIRGYPELALSAQRDDLLVVLLSIQEIYDLDKRGLDKLLSQIDLKKVDSPFDEYWKGQNHPVRVMDPCGRIHSVLPLLSHLVQCEEDELYDLLEPPESYGWGDEFANTFAWGQNAYKVVYFSPGSGYGGLPDSFPDTDREGRKITPQAQIDRFLLLVDAAYGGFIDDHIDVPPRQVAEAILKLQEELGEYSEVEDGIEWELAANSSLSADK